MGCLFLFAIERLPFLIHRTAQQDYRWLAEKARASYLDSGPDSDFAEAMQFSASFNPENGLVRGQGAQMNAEGQFTIASATAPTACPTPAPSSASSSSRARPPCS